LIVLVGLGVGVIALIITISIQNREIGAQFADIVAAIVAMIAFLSGGVAVLTSKRADPPVVPEPDPAPPEEVEAPTPTLPPPTTTPTKAQSVEGSRLQSAIIRSVAVLAFAAAFVVGALLLIPDKQDPALPEGTFTDEYGHLHQNLVHISGPEPVLFDGGKTWKWLDLPKGETVVTFSPGGGSRNDGLESLSGPIYETGNCNSSLESDLAWSFKGDGHFLGDDSDQYPYPQLVPLPDHVDQIVLTIETTYDPREKCTLGLEWRNPSIKRNKPLADPSPSPSPS
jgi:hypothetical protein